MTESPTPHASSHSPELPAEARGARRNVLRWLLLAAALHGLAYLLLLPPWMGEDEPWHVEYAHYVALGHMPWGGRDISVADLPLYSPSQIQVVRELGGVDREEIISTQLAILNSMRAHHFWERVDWASWGGGAQNFDQLSPYFSATHQPPLYYVVVGTISRVIGDGEVLTEMWIGRGLALLAYLAVVLAGYALATRVTQDSAVVLLCAFFVAWWPMHARQAAVVNNDTLVKVFTAWTLVLALDIARRGFDRRRLFLVTVLASLGLATKTTAVGVLVPLLCAALWSLGKGQVISKGRRRLVVASLALVLLALFALIPFAYQFTNNPAVPLHLENFLERLHRAAQPAFRDEFLRTTIGAFNWYSRDLSPLVHQLVGYALALAGVGFVFALVKPRAQRDATPDLRKGLAWLCVIAIAAQIALVVLRGTAAGRYAIPVLPAFALCLAAGWVLPWPRGARALAASLACLALVLFDVYFLWAGLVWNQFGVWGS